MPHVRSSAMTRRLTGIVVAGALLTGGLLTTAAPTAAATAPPWRFKTVEQTAHVVAGGSQVFVLYCPSGYRPVWGGITGDSDWPSAHGVKRWLEYTDQPTASYRVGVQNWGGSTASIRIVVNCVWTDNFGDIQYVSVDFTRNENTKRAGGMVPCPAGYQALTGGADWAGTQGRTIDYSAPHLDVNGNATGWFASGWNPDNTPRKLTVEVYCLQDSYLASAYAEVDISGPGPNLDRGATAVCATGYRILTGGAMRGESLPTSDRGWAWMSGPADARHWPARAWLVSTDTLSAIAICVPVSTPSVSITTAPPQLTNSRSATLAFAASDQAGEDLSLECKLYQPGGVSTLPCQSGVSLTFNNLSDGGYAFQAKATNQSGILTSDSTYWQVDGARPIVSATSPASALPLLGPVKLTFSERVTGVVASVIQAHGAATDVDVTGTVSAEEIEIPHEPSYTEATWRPSTPLVPGETYRFTVTNAIKDRAGNRLVPTFWDVRAQTAVENTSVAMKEWWDFDQDPMAGDGNYVTSRDPGSSAMLTFRTTPGQSVSIFGIRGPDGGYADIYLDGVKKSTATFFAATQARARVYQSAALATGAHTISIRVLGKHPSASTSSWVSIDNLVVGSTVREETALRQSFRRVGATDASGGSYDLTTRVTDSDGAPAYSATFVGQGVKIYATKSPTSGEARVFVDTVLKQTINLHAASTVYQALVYSASLTAGVHTVRIVPVGTANGTNSAVGIDRITVQ